jgi:hypothetical protein
MVKDCLTCRYSYDNTAAVLCTHSSVGHAVNGGLNQVQCSHASHSSKLCGDERRYYERRVQKVARIEPVVKQKFITGLINEFMKE